MRAIKFGTDGWRDNMQEPYFEETLLIIAHSIVNVLERRNLLKRGLVVSYDTRKNSRKMAEEICEHIVANEGFPLYFTKRDTPTPVIAHLIKKLSLGGGIMITASHNPPQFNGLKFINHNASPATTIETNAIEREIRKVAKRSLSSHRKFDEAKSQGLIKVIDPATSYIRRVFDLIDTEIFQRKKLKIVFDPMYGTTRGYLDKMLKDLKHNVITIHDVPDPNFGGISPDPSPENLFELREMVIRRKADLGIACDGDGDRVGFIDKNGRFYSTNSIYPIILYNILKKGDYGGIARTVITTRTVDKIAKKFNIPVYETPVGSKWLATLFLKKRLLLAGEATGGLIFRGHIPERDGMLTGLKLVETLLERDVPLSSLSDEIGHLFGTTFSGSENIACGSENDKKLIMELIEKKAEVFKRKIGAERLRKVDGILFEFSDGSWLHMRPSGTEPLFRIIAESTSDKKISCILSDAKEFIKEIFLQSH